MRKILLLFGILLMYISLKAQDINHFQSRTEQFLNAQGKFIAGYTLYSTNILSDKYYNVSNHSISLMKYVDSSVKDTMLGIIFYGSIDRGSGNSILWKYYRSIIDYDEVKNIISWIELAKQQITKDSLIDYFSYTPKSGSLLLYITKNKDKGFLLNIQYDKYDLNSYMTLFSIDNKKSVIDFVKLDDYCIKLKDGHRRSW